MTEWPHPGRCPGSDCVGAFFWIEHYGVICSEKLYQETQLRYPNRSTCGAYAELTALQLSREAQLEHSEGLGLA